MNILLRMASALDKPEKALDALRPELESLIGDLDRAAEAAESDPLSAITAFFAVTSPWHDRGLHDVIDAFARVNDGKYDLIIGRLVTLNEQFARTGRSEYGCNRTKPGEAVVAERIFLGNIHGLFTLPVSRWKEARGQPKDSWGSVVNMSPYDVICDQAQRLITSQAAVIRDRTRDLLAT